MEFLVLGPIEVHSAGDMLPVGGVKQRSLLALLVLHRGHSLSTDQIAEDIYGEDAALGARRSIQTHVAVLRRELGDVITSTSDGYVFDAPRDAVDACRFEDAIASGLDALDRDPGRASVLFREALGLWRGDPYADVDGQAVFEPEIIRLNELHMTALVARIEADLACGRHRQVLPELESLVAEHPLRERLWALLMLALYRSGRQAEALRAFQKLNQELGEELGIEPSTELRDLENRVLLQDPDLDLVAPIPHNLRHQMTTFIGQELQLMEIATVLEGTRLLTLTGAGGSGKTRIAVEFAQQNLDHYPDGAWFVDLRDAEAVGLESFIASTLGINTTGEGEMIDRLVEALAPRHLLLVLDNCEHVLDGVAPIVEQLTSRNTRIRVLATSREAIGIPGESIIILRPLSLPNSAELGELSKSEAAVLFVDRARASDRGFVVDEHVDSTFRICRSVEGLPLALELAAATLAVFSPEELADRLEDQIGLLRTRLRAGDLRHQTIEETIRWSWELLIDVEQTLLSRLSVFRGSWSLDAAEQVCGFDPVREDQVADLVASLVAKSLVVVDGVAAASTRYRLLEPIRQFAAREINTQARDQIQSRLIDYWAAALPGSFEPESRFEWRNHDKARELAADQANLVATVEWALETGRFEDAMAIYASPFGDLLILRGSNLDMAVGWMRTAIEHQTTVSHGVLLSALEVSASAALRLNHYELARSFAELGIEYSRTPEERRWYELTATVMTQWLDGHTQQTAAAFRRLATEAEGPGLRASALLAEAHNGQAQQGWLLLRQAMELPSAGTTHLWDESWVSFYIFDIAEDSGHYDIAMQHGQRSLDVSRRYESERTRAIAAARLARLCAARGQVSEVAPLIAEALSIDRRTWGPSDRSPMLLTWASRAARFCQDLDRAQEYADEALGIADSRLWLHVQPAVEAALIARDRGELDRAQAFLDDCPRLLADLTNADFIPWLQTGIDIAQASISLRQGDPKRALACLNAALKSPGMDIHTDMLDAVDLTAIALAQQGTAKPAARLKGAVDNERDDCGLVIYPPDTRLRDASMGHAQSLLEDNWDTMVQQGRTLTLEEAIDLAITESGMSDVLAESPKVG